MRLCSKTQNTQRMACVGRHGNIASMLCVQKWIAATTPVLKPDRIPAKWPDYSQLMAHSFEINNKDTFSNVCLPLRDVKRRRRGDSGMCSLDNTDTRDSLVKQAGHDRSAVDTCSKMPAANGTTNGYHSVANAHRP